MGSGDLCSSPLFVNALGPVSLQKYNLLGGSGDLAFGQRQRYTRRPIAPEYRSLGLRTATATETCDVDHKCWDGLPGPTNPDGPCTKIAYTLAPKYLFRDYFQAKVYTVWVHGPLGKSLEPCRHPGAYLHVGMAGGGY